MAQGLLEVDISGFFVYLPSEKKKTIFFKAVVNLLNAFCLCGLTVNRFKSVIYERPS